MTDSILPPKSWHATPVDKATLAKHFTEVETFPVERTRLENRSRRAAWIMTGVTSTIALASTISVLMMVPLQRQVPIPILIHEDGSTNIAWSWRDVMADSRVAVVTSALWFYVQSRESYNWVDARRNYDAVGAMSNETTRAVYERWFLPSNPDSPQLKVGRKGSISLQPDGSVLSRDSQVARIFFWKIVHMDGIEPVKTHWTVTLDYQINESVSASSRLFNPLGIFVTSYSARQDTAK